MRFETGSCGVALLLAAAVAQVALADTPSLPLYRITAALSPKAPHIYGRVELTFINHSGQPVDDLVWLTFPNRFGAPDSQVDDFNRPFVYPRQEFDPGWMDILDVRVDGHLVPASALEHSGLPQGCALRVPLSVPLPAGAAATITVRFETRLPSRFGTFGEVGEMLTAIGGWYPYLAALRPDGTWAVDELPGLADFDVELAVPEDLEVVLNGQHFPRPSPFIHTRLHGVHYLSLVAAPQFLRDEIRAGTTRIVFFHRPAQLASRISSEPPQTDITLVCLRDVVERRPAEMPEYEGDLVVVEAPLRLHLTAAGEGMMVVSDRTLKVSWPLRPFHEMQLAQAAYAEFLRPALAPRESERDYVWVSEGLSYVLARRYLADAHPGARSVHDWVELFNIFAIVDRFETAPKIPFVESFFEQTPRLDELHEQISTFNNDLPPGHVVLGKLRQLTGARAFRTLIDHCLPANEPFRECAASERHQNLDWFFSQWLQAFPDINYDFGSVRLNEPHDGMFYNDVVVRRHATREIREPVDVRLRTIGGAHVDLRWDGAGEQARLTTVTPRRVCQAIIDPERQLIETTRADNARPPVPQIVLDSAEVEVTSTEFGLSGLVVGRKRYDYRQDLAAAGFYTNRSVGVDTGARYHWGAQNDPTSYRHNVFAFYDVQALSAGFTAAQQPEVRTPGHINGLGMRYDYNNIVAYDNPTQEVQLRLFADWYDGALGSSYDFINWGGNLVLTHPLWTYRTILAGEVFNGFSEPLGSNVVPNQALFSLGGSLSIRGIGAEDELARNIFVLRAELRQAVYPELDLNLFDLLVLRRAQLRVFLDSGQVSNSAGAVYDPAGYAVGVGAGFAAVYDFMGFFPSMAYIELATRVDRPSNTGDVQVLFGTRQSF